MGNEAKLPINDVISWIESIFYLNSKKLKEKGIKANLTIYNGLELVQECKFKPKPFSELLSRIIPASIKKNQLSEMISFENDTTFMEESKTLVVNDDGSTSVEMADEEKSMHIDVALRYCIAPDASYQVTYDTFCNSTNTIDNGTHLDALDEAFCRYMQNKVNASMSDAQKSKLKVTWEDIRTNLFCVFNMSTNAQVGFVGNAKTKVNSKDLMPYIKDMVTESLDEIFSKNNSLLEEYIRIIKLSTKARQEAMKAKTATQTEKIDNFKALMMKNFIPCNNRGKQWKELFIVEGDSAGGSVRNGCDPDTQAAFLCRGVPANANKCTLAEIMQNREWRDLITVLRCGIGDKFDLSKLYFDRINILADSDIDGLNITCGVLVFFYLYLRPIIEAGKLYKVYAPLYKIDDKENPYIENKAKMTELYRKNIMKIYSVKIGNDDSFMNSDEMYEFLMDTYNYRDNLILASENSGRIDKFFIEMVAAYLTLYGVDEYNYNEKFKDRVFIKNIMRKIQKKYKEIKVDTESCNFSGIVKGKFVSVKISPRFFKKTSDLKPVYLKYGYELTVKKKKDGEPYVTTIGGFLDESIKCKGDILFRYKGLGELDGKELWKTTMDINNRVSVQYTVEDVERELEIFNMTHGKSTNDVKRRKEMMKKFKIDREDLDN